MQGSRISHVHRRCSALNEHWHPVAQRRAVLLATALRGKGLTRCCLVGRGQKQAFYSANLRNKRQERDVFASLGSPLLVFLNLRVDTNRCLGTENRQMEAGRQFTASKRRAPGSVSSPSHSFLGGGKRQAGMEVSHMAGRGQELYKKEKAA